MMNLNQAITYGRNIGVSYYIYNSNGRLVGGTQTYAQALIMKHKFEAEERRNPFTGGTIRYEIREAK